MQQQAGWSWKPIFVLFWVILVVNGVQSVESTVHLLLPPRNFFMAPKLCKVAQKEYIYSNRTEMIHSTWLVLNLHGYEGLILFLLTDLLFQAWIIQYLLIQVVTRGILVLIISKYCISIHVKAAIAIDESTQQHMRS